MRNESIHWPVPMWLHKMVPRVQTPMNPVYFSELDDSSAALRRSGLLEELRAALNYRPVPVPFWALLQVCSLDKLEALVDMAPHSPNGMENLIEMAADVLFSWDNSYDDIIPVREMGKGGLRDVPFGTKRALIREQSRCAITQDERGQLCFVRIFPGLSFLDGRSWEGCDFWRFLTFFWDKDMIDRWARAVFRNPMDPLDAVDGIHNQLWLRADLFELLAMNKVALHPTMAWGDGTGVDVELQWLSRQNHRHFDMVDLLKAPVQESHQHQVGNYPTLQREYAIITPDRVNLPLPDVHLLEMQWYMKRILALCNVSRLPNPKFTWHWSYPWVGALDMWPQNTGSFPQHPVWGLPTM